MASVERYVEASKAKVIAPVGFLEAAVAENVLVGTAMSRRAMYYTGVLLPDDAKGRVGVGLGLSASTGAATLIPRRRDHRDGPEDGHRRPHLRV